MITSHASSSYCDGCLSVKRIVPLLLDRWSGCLATLASSLFARYSTAAEKPEMSNCWSPTVMVFTFPPIKTARPPAVLQTSWLSDDALSSPLCKTARGQPVLGKVC